MCVHILTPTHTHTAGQDISVIVFMGVVGGLVLIILMMLFFIMFIVLSVRWRSSHRNDKANKQRSQSISGTMLNINYIALQIRVCMHTYTCMHAYSRYS